MIRVIQGDCREVLAGMTEASVDSCVTDPPYHLTANQKGGSGEASVNLSSPHGRSRITAGFMGQAWDGGDVAFRPETWEAVFRVLKPGAHLVAFGGTRTYHRLACAIEDAGFEIRDAVLDLYETSPQWAALIESLSPAQAKTMARALGGSSDSLLAWLYGSGFPKSLNVQQAINKSERGFPQGGRDPSSPNHGKFKGGCSDDNPGGRGFGAGAGAFMAEQGAARGGDDGPWHGWGTALKPAWEPIVLARKPLVGTVAANVLAHGTGALNIDGCRIKTGDDLNGGAYSGNLRRRDEYTSTDRDGSAHLSRLNRGAGEYVPPLGRWPANLVHDGSAEVLAGFPDAPAQQRAVGPEHGAKPSVNVFGDFGPRDTFNPRGDSGSAARFFYCAKATKAERGEGNNHPTVKPVALMRWLVRLVTPPGGVVLDPFAGSGTTGLAASIEQFDATLIEMSLGYAEIARNRIAMDAGMFAE